MLTKHNWKTIFFLSSGNTQIGQICLLLRITTPVVGGRTNGPDATFNASWPNRRSNGWGVCFSTCVQQSKSHSFSSQCCVRVIPGYSVSQSKNHWIVKAFRGDYLIPHKRSIPASSCHSNVRKSHTNRLGSCFELDCFFQNEALTINPYMGEEPING